MFSIKNLSVSIETHPILKELNLEIAPGRVHAIMGPNGSGKSTLAQTVIGNPLYDISNGSIELDGIALQDLALHERARKGIFLSFQQPPAIPGLRVVTLLKEIRQAGQKESIDIAAFQHELKNYCALLQMDECFLERNCNDGFSGGERKRFELLQLLVAHPRVIILDEIDSGLDIDALRLVARVMQKIKTDNPACMILIITHYQRILDYIVPDRVHVLMNGTIIQSGDAHLVHELEQTGYTNLV